LQPPFDTFYGATAYGDEPPPEVRRRLGIDIDCTVCVVGAGFAGLWTARALAARGYDVVVIERDRVGAGASGRNAGFVGPGYAQSLEKLVGRVGIDHAQALWALSREGVEIVRRTVHGTPLMPVGGRLEVRLSDDEDIVRRKSDWLAHRFETPTEVWSTREVRDVLRSTRYHQGLLFPEAFHLDPLALAHLLAAELEKAGVRIFEETEALEADLAGVRKHVVTANGRVRARHVVLSAGIPSGHVWPAVARAVTPISTYIGVTEDLGDRLGEAIQFPGGVTDNLDIGNYFRRIGDRLLWGSGGTTRQGVPRGLGRRLEGEIARVFPVLKGVKIEHAWAGTMAYAVHSMPQIGRLRPDVWLCTAFGGRGLNTTAMAGELIASAIAEHDERWKLFAPFGLVGTGGVVGKLAAEMRLRAMAMADAR